ncbi:MAG TPA: chemotaxis protein CheB [Dokdonella sp.]|uniref:chemotaxis protein CheB n=1 Tax=Dokdonella sp. TaxID=2291710 RepID=UPI002C011375|nr:chemotaxis protein CheB [Dokdonella sp.]HUD42480.1 chemotaxis protein CheB [Dokdonella sp.]
MATETSVPVALLFQTDELGRHLRAVLNDIGTPIVYESTTHAIDRVSLEQSGARVVVVNLDSELDGDLDQVYDLLGDGPYRVLINEGHVSSRLSGWDQARWMRHLAAKILDTPAETDPPRPADAEPVPAPPAPASATPADESVAAIDGSAVSQPTTAEAAIGRLEEAVPAPSEALEAADLRVADIDEDEPFSFDDLDVAPPLAPPEAGEAAQTLAYETLEAVSLDIEPLDVDALDVAPHTSASTDAAPLDSEPIDLDPLDARLVSDASEFDAVAAPRIAASAAADADAQVDAVAFSDEEARLFAAFDTAGDGEPARRDAPAADLDDWLSRAMADDPDAAIERPHWEEEPAETEAPVARLDTQPVFSESFQPAGDDPKPAVPAVPAVPDWNLVSFDLDDEGAPQAPPAPFGVEKISAAEYMAAASPYAGEEAEETIETDGLSFELVPIEDAIAPQPARAAHEVWLDADAVAAASAVPDAKAGAAVDRVVVLCASIGGPEAIREVIGAIPKRYPALFVLVQHMGEEFIDLLAQQLARATALTVRVPSHGERVAAGDLLIAPPNRELRIQRDGTVLIQPQNPPAPHQPSIDRILESVAATFGADVLAIVFSGMSDDGAAGCRQVAEAGGQVWVQDPATCVVSEMVENALATGVVGFQGSPTSLAEHLAGLRDGAAEASA